MSGALILLTFAARGEENALSNLSTQQQFLNALHTHQEQTRIGIQQSDREILSLEHRMVVNDAEVERKQRELSGLNAMPAFTPEEQLWQSEARQRARSALEQAKGERQRLDADWERQERERAQLGRDERKLQRLESEYDANPQRAGELMRELRSK